MLAERGDAGVGRHAVGVNRADPPSLTLVAATLDRLRDVPLLVLALARPDVHTQAPSSWASRDVVEVRLAGLPRSACRQLIRAVVGDALDEDVVERLCARAGGNALFLEELLRVVSDDGPDERYLHDVPVNARILERARAWAPTTR